MREQEHKFLSVDDLDCSSRRLQQNKRGYDGRNKAENDTELNSSSTLEQIPNPDREDAYVEREESGSMMEGDESVSMVPWMTTIAARFM